MHCLRASLDQKSNDCNNLLGEKHKLEARLEELEGQLEQMSILKEQLEADLKASQKQVADAKEEAISLKVTVHHCRVRLQAFLHVIV